MFFLFFALFRTKNIIISLKKKVAAQVGKLRAAVLPVCELAYVISFTFTFTFTLKFYLPCLFLLFCQRALLLAKECNSFPKLGETMQCSEAKPSQARVKQQQQQ